MSSALPWDQPPRRRRILPGFLRHRSVWTTLGVTLLVLLLAGGISTYALHRYFEHKAAGFDMGDLSKMESASTIYDRRGQVFGHIYLQNREPVPLAQMPLDLQRAVIAAEDADFYSHAGYSPLGILRAALKNFGAGRSKQGASTITQQLARNTFPLGGRNLQRKLLEVYVARRIELTLTKDQILEYYLNRIYLGSGLYGVEAAAKGYFNKPTRELTLPEAATIAGMIKAPNRLSPWNDRKGAQWWRDFELNRMVAVNFITREQADAALREPLVVAPRTFASAESYAVEAIRQAVIAQVGADDAVSRGYRIYATVDGEIQRAAETSLRQALDNTERHPAFQALNHPTFAAYAQQFKDEERRVAAVAATKAPNAQAPSVHENLKDPAYLQGALLSLDNTTGGILAVVGGRDFKHSEYNRATSPTARRPMGTAFTPLVFAAAYQKGTSPNAVFLDQNIDNRQVMIGGETGILGEWGVERADNRYEGPLTATVTLAKGKNAAAVRVGNEVGLKDVLALAQRAGFTSTVREYPATFLGASEVSLGELAMAYTAFPNGGWRPAAPFIVAKIEDNEGNIVFQAKPGPRARVIDENPAYQVHNALAESLKWGTAEAATTRLGLKPTVGVGGKTGTAYGFTDAVFCGYDSEVTCAVWMGFDNARTPIYRGAFGGDLCLPVWVQVINAAHARNPSRDVNRPKALRRVELCAESGEQATDRCFETVNGERRRTTYFDYLAPAQVPKRPCSLHAVGAKGTLALNNFGINRVNKGGALPNSRRAESAVDLSQFQPVQPKSHTILDDDRDPYGTLQPAPAPAAPAPDDVATAGGNNGGAGAGPEIASPPAVPVGTPEPEIRRAQTVSPFEQETARRPVQVEKPPPLEFN